MIQHLISAFVEVVLETIVKAVWGALKAILAGGSALFRRFREGLH